MGVGQLMGETSLQYTASCSLTVWPHMMPLERIWVLDPLPAWTPSLSSLTRLAKGPKHHLCDPAPAARLLGATAARLLRGDGRSLAVDDRPLVGQLFESLVCQAVRSMAEVAGSRVSHLRTRNGDREVALIVERDDGAVLAIEVKLAGDVGDDDVRHLRWLSSTLGDRLLDAVVITTGPGAYRRPDGIGVVPLALLGP